MSKGDSLVIPHDADPRLRLGHLRRRGAMRRVALLPKRSRAALCRLRWMSGWSRQDGAVINRVCFWQAPRRTIVRPALSAALAEGPPARNTQVLPQSVNNAGGSARERKSNLTTHTPLTRVPPAANADLSGWPRSRRKQKNKPYRPKRRQRPSGRRVPETGMSASPFSARANSVPENRPIGASLQMTQRETYLLLYFNVLMAEGVGFEPTVRVNARRFSRPVP